MEGASVSLPGPMSSHVISNFDYHLIDADEIAERARRSEKQSEYTLNIVRRAALLTLKEMLAHAQSI